MKKKKGSRQCKHKVVRDKKGERGTFKVFRRF
jgi:hypothetical protein